jgi:hypothetical protein
MAAAVRTDIGKALAQAAERTAASWGSSAHTTDEFRLAASPGYWERPHSARAGGQG